MYFYSNRNADEKASGEGYDDAPQEDIAILKPKDMLKAPIPLPPPLRSS